MCYYDGVGPVKETVFVCNECIHFQDIFQSTSVDEDYCTHPSLSSPCHVAGGLTPKWCPETKWHPEPENK